MAKRVLLITRAFYPLNASGAHRPAKLAKYLPDFGWTPVVLCPDWTPESSPQYYDSSLAARPDVCRTIRVPYPKEPKGRLGRALRRMAETIWPYRAPFGFARRLLSAADTVVRKERFHALWSTYTPGLTHYVAGRAAKRHGIPWVADFRDLPDIDLRGFQLQRHVKGEVRACRNASALVTVSTPLAEVLQSRHRAPLHVIPNGFDPQDFPEPQDRVSDRFTVGYYGTVTAYEDPTPLFGALDRLSDQGKVDLQDFRLNFFGSRPERISELSGRFRCREVVDVHPRVPYGEMIRLQQETTVLLLLSTSIHKGVTTGKVFDYLGVGRPVLDVPGGDVTTDLLADTDAGVSASDVGEVTRALKMWYDEWKSSGTVAFRGRPDAIRRYSRREQAGQLARILDAVCDADGKNGNRLEDTQHAQAGQVDTNTAAAGKRGRGD